MASTPGGSFWRRRPIAATAWIVAGCGAIAFLVAKAITAPDGVPDPTSVPLSHGAAVIDSGLLVFREGLEVVLVVAAVTASFVGARRSLRKPVAAGAGLALGASVATWFLAIAVIGALGGPGLDVQAATGLLAVVVLLVVMNWFFHRLYWTGWIQHHNRRRRDLRRLAGAGAASDGGLDGRAQRFRPGARQLRRERDLARAEPGGELPERAPDAGAGICGRVRLRPDAVHP